MSKITYCVKPRGEGKTRWLVEQAANEHENERNIWYAGTSESYEHFCETYLSLIGKVCPVLFLEMAEEIERDDVVVIDNGMSYTNLGEVVEALEPFVYKLYITLEGNLASEYYEYCSEKNSDSEDNLVQLTIEDGIKEGAIE